MTVTTASRLAGPSASGGRRPFSPAEDGFIVAHYGDMTIRAMAVQLGRQAGALQQHIDRLVRAGQLSRDRRSYDRRWTDDEEDYLSDQWGRLPDAMVARKLGRTVNACKIRATRFLSLARQDNLYTARTVGLLFGVDASTVLTWLDRGWLTGRPSGTRCGRDHRKWDIDERSIERFIETMGWAYDWRRMDESYHRNLAERVYRADPWLTLDEAARQIGWQRARIDRWLSRGLLPHQRRPKQQKAGAPVIVVRKADLPAFVVRVAAAVHENRSAARRRRRITA